MSVSSASLAHALTEHQVIAPDEVEMLLHREQTERRPLAQILLVEGRATEKQLCEAHASSIGMPFVDLETTPISPDAIALMTPMQMRTRRALPLAVHEGALYLAIADAADIGVAHEVSASIGMPVHVALAAPGEIDLRIGELAPTVGPGGPGGPVPGGDWMNSPAPGNGAGPQMAAGAATAAAAGVINLRESGPGDPSGNGHSMRPGQPGPQEQVASELHVNDMLARVLETGSSDLHLTAGSRPQMRLHGELMPMDEFPMLEPNELRRMLYAIMTQKQREKFESTWELDFSHPLPGSARFRVNTFFQRGAIGAVMRTIPNEIVPLEKLGLPRVVREFAHLPRGLVLVTGPTGSGKSTTLASLIDIVNSELPVHIMTVEDPIEFLHSHKRALVNQREVGEDTKGFGDALRHVLRQDPDVILVGELRDLETIQTALTAAETGHLVYATLHTQDAPQSIDRIIDVFPPHQQQQVRVQLATSIQAVVTQQLVRTHDGRGRAVASEVMVATPAIRNLIREGKIFQIYSSMQAGGQHGMQTMDQSLADLVKARRITYELALERSQNPGDLARLCGKV